MAVYSVNSLVGGGTQQATTATYMTQIALTAASATLTSAAINDIEFGTAGTPSDNYMEYDVSRQTAAGSGGTTATPNPMDLAKRASGTVAYCCATGEGTVTANTSVLYIPVNQRASYRWVAVPGAELVIPATNLYGFALRSRSAAYTGKVGMTAIWVE
jgi:hypothetical protein